MSRDAGQLTTRQALAGVLVALAVLGGVVELCRWLLPEADTETALTAPARDEEEGRGCPEPADLPPEPIPVTSPELIACPELYDGLTVRFEGEAVNAVLHRGQRAWLQLNDDPYSQQLGPLPEHRLAVGGNAGMPVMVPVDLAERIAFAGGYEARGDAVAVVGTFHRADPLDGGLPSIQSVEATITRPGYPLTHHLPVRQLAVAALLAVVTLVLLAFTVRARRR